MSPKQAGFQHIAMHGEITEKIKSQETKGANLTIQKLLPRKARNISVERMRPELQSDLVRYLAMNFSERENVFKSLDVELKIEILAFGKQERCRFLTEYTKQAQLFAWNILNFMKSDQAVCLAQWFDADSSRITALSEIFGWRPESDVKSSLLKIFDCVPVLRYADKRFLLQDLLEFKSDMQKIQDTQGIPAHAVGHAATVLTNAEAISRRFPFPPNLKPRYTALLTIFSGGEPDAPLIHAESWGSGSGAGCSNDLTALACLPA